MSGKPIYASKTFWFGILMILVTVAGFFGYGQWQPDADSWVATVLQVLVLLEPVIIIMLRKITKEPIV